MKKKQKLVAFTGSGISDESGLATFRGNGGRWAEYDVMEVASIEGWHKNPDKVLNFYNLRREEAAGVKPNDGHRVLALLEEHFEVVVITQNVDNLHEMAGSSRIIHLHGELFKSRSTADPKLIYEVKGTQVNPGDLCEKGSQLRPHIVFFGEEVPMMSLATEEVESADIFVVVGTSLQVYPAASLVDYAAKEIPKYVVDPHIPDYPYSANTTLIAQPASVGMKQLFEILTGKPPVL